jgi:tRNA pseudouridine38-40 synthase
MPELDTDTMPRRRLALLLEYQGTRFAGSQLQTSARTVQGELEAAIEKTTSESMRCAFAGRTDSGVHARGQVAAFSTGSSLSADTLRRALNHWLPPDVSVLAAADVPPAFDPRRSALRRHYRYVVENRPSRPAIDRRFAWYVGQPLDLDAMGEAAALLLGEHDFAAFASAPEDAGASTIRRLECFSVRSDGNRIVVDAIANAFLPHQVRRMVGSLVEVGRGKMPVAGYRALLEGAPASAGPAAPARGLTLLSVDYPVDPFAHGGLGGR